MGLKDVMHQVRNRLCGKSVGEGREELLEFKVYFGRQEREALRRVQTVVLDSLREREEIRADAHPEKAFPSFLRARDLSSSRGETWLSSQSPSHLQEKPSGVASVEARVVPSVQKVGNQAVPTHAHVTEEFFPTLGEEPESKESKNTFFTKTD